MIKTLFTISEQLLWNNYDKYILTDDYIERLKILEKIKGEFRVVYAQVLHGIHTISEVHKPLSPKEKIIFSIARYIFILTYSAYVIEEMFSIVVYDSIDDLIKLVRYYLTIEDERREISSRAHEMGYKDHTYKYRIEALICRIV